jgi:hypothetical protein
MYAGEGEAVQRCDVPAIVAAIRQDYADSEGPVPSAYGRSVGDHARIWGWRWTRVILESPPRLEHGRVDRKRALERLDAIMRAVDTVVEERLEQIRTNRATEVVE